MAAIETYASVRECLRSCNGKLAYGRYELDFSGTQTVDNGSGTVTVDRIKNKDKDNSVIGAIGVGYKISNRYSATLEYEKTFSELFDNEAEIYNISIVLTAAY